MAHRRAELLRESHDHSRKIADAKQRLQQQSESDVVFFEGLPFHYLDPSALPSNKPAASAKKPQQQQQLPVAEETSSKPRPALAHSSSTVVSESDSDNDNTFLPSFSPSKMDWDGPLSCPTLQAHMRRSSFQSFAKDGALIDSRPLEEDIESFFQGFEMPVDLYHEQIENMEEDDDTAFGYLLEQAISE